MYQRAHAYLVKGWYLQPWCRFSWYVSVLFFLSTTLLSQCAHYEVPLGASCAGSPEHSTWTANAWGWSPPDNAGSPNIVGLGSGEEPGSGADTLVALYQKYLRRPSRGSCCGCPFHPTCSVYSRQAFRRYGQLIGLALTLDRLLLRENLGREGYYPSICVRGREVLFDPVP